MVLNGFDRCFRGLDEVVSEILGDLTVALEALLKSLQSVMVSECFHGVKKLLVVYLLVVRGGQRFDFFLLCNMSLPIFHCNFKHGTAVRPTI